jgi:hypothetical protein
MLAQLQSDLPSGDGCRYEPKLDGFRGLLQRHSSTTTRVLSRNGRDLGPWFPELLQAGQALPTNTLVDGEIVIADERGQIDVGALQARLTVARKDVSRAASEPTSLTGGARIIPRLARRGVESSETLGRYRWVVERTNAWILAYRRLAVRFDRQAASVLASLDLACVLICLRFLHHPEED